MISTTTDAAVRSGAASLQGMLVRVGQVRSGTGSGSGQQLGVDGLKNGVDAHDVASTALRTTHVEPHVRECGTGPKESSWQCSCCAAFVDHSLVGGMACVCLLSEETSVLFGSFDYGCARYIPMVHYQTCRTFL